jgi:hypothetical protein
MIQKNNQKELISFGFSSVLAKPDTTDMFDKNG